MTHGIFFSRSQQVPLCQVVVLDHAKGAEDLLVQWASSKALHEQELMPYCGYQLGVPSDEGLWEMDW